MFPADGTPRLEVDSDIRALQSKENGFMLSAIHALAGQLVTSAEAAHESIDCGEAFRFGAKFGRHYIKSHTRSGVMICPASKAPHEPLAGGDAKGAA